jgi:hypothetical protein
MKIGGRYKLIGKKRHALLDLPKDAVFDIFEKALCESCDSRLVGSYDSGAEIFKIEYKVDHGKKEAYETYLMLVEVSQTNDGTRIEYAFVYDKLLSWYTKILSIICFAVPLIASGLVFFKFQLHSLIHLAIYIPLLLISSFGLFSLFGYKEDKEDIKPMVKEFEQLLMDSFS